jgi:hypothetical protein
MAASLTFDSTVAARTRAVSQLINDPALLESFIAMGGLLEDLVTIRDQGRTAELLAQAQESTRSDGKAATLDVVAQFTALREEYALILAVLRALFGMLKRANADKALLQRLADIIANHAETGIAEITLADGTKQKKAKKKLSQEAVRAEIERDAAALLAFPEISAALDARRVPRARLEKLRDDAMALGDKLGDRVAKKGASKAATKDIRAAVKAQSEAWGAAYTLLAMLGRENEQVRALLKDAVRAKR